MDLNTLMCFQENLSEQEIAAFANQVYETMHQQGFACGFAQAMEKIQEYPNCDKLICMIASVLEGGLIFFRVEEKENYQQQIDALYHRLLDSEDTAGSQYNQKDVSFPLYHTAELSAGTTAS